MKSKKTILRRITTLYVVFFVVIAFGIVRTVSRFSGEDFNTGRNDARRMVAAARMADGRNVELMYDLRGATSTTGTQSAKQSSTGTLCAVQTMASQPSAICSRMFSRSSAPFEATVTTWSPCT